MQERFIVADNQQEITRDATANPLAEHLTVTVSMPDTIQIRMVDARVLEDYEIWFFISSLLFAVVVGFGVPLLQSYKAPNGVDNMLLANTGVFIVLFGVSLIVALRKRYALKCKSKTITLKVVKG